MACILSLYLGLLSTQGSKSQRGYRGIKLRNLFKEYMLICRHFGSHADCSSTKIEEVRQNASAQIERGRFWCSDFVAAKGDSG